MTDLLTLAEACEKASGPNFQLEQEIGAAVFPKRADPYPAYTASLDAAMTLVPEGCCGQVQFGLRPGAWVEPIGTAYPADFNTAATPALALTAAALRAREVTHEPRAD